MKSDSQQKIPAQEKGEQLDTIETVKAADEEEAREIFQAAKKRLLNVSGWSLISKGISAHFELTDQYGRPKEGAPAPGDHFRINIPGPGSPAGEGYDWVKVELVDDSADSNELSECVTIKVRPSPDPTKQEGVAHFLQEDATSSFVVKRKFDKVSAEVHGRNEKVNTTAEKIPDKIRNAVVGTAAVKGAAKIQWQKLVKGLLNIQ